ncbi:hypothetical protein GQ600_12066 [Phytophthora cactorum]|nr:hypothetical protein GQ600_12066 [Phytophthora cactorum]
MKPTSECVEDADETTLELETQAVKNVSNLNDIAVPLILLKSSISAAAVLPIDKVIALIDLLGDQVVDAQETYELFADEALVGPSE